MMNDFLWASVVQLCDINFISKDPQSLSSSNILYASMIMFVLMLKGVSLPGYGMDGWPASVKRKRG